MNLDELRTVQSKERSKDSLQHLRESFYADVGRYIADLKDRRERAADQASDPFDDPDVNRLTDEINTAEEVVEAVYERRVGKVVKRASLAAAGMPADEEGLTSEEQRLFSELVERIEENKAEVLDVLGGDVGSTGSESTDAPPDDASAIEADATAPETPNGGNSSPDADVSAADVMGSDGASAPETASPGDASTASDNAVASDPAAASDAGRSTAGETADAATEDDGDRPSAEATAVTGDGGAGDDGAGGNGGAPDPQSATDATRGQSPTERTTVRITSDVGEIFGVDERTYDLADEDVVSLPAENAGPLVEQGAAEKLE